MRKFVKYGVMFALAVIMMAGRANAGVNDVWFSSDKVDSGTTVDVYMSTNGTWFGFNLAMSYDSSKISGFTFTADNAFLTAIGGSVNVARSGNGALADGTNGYYWETMPLTDRLEWNGKIGTLELTLAGADASQVGISTVLNAYEYSTAIYENINFGTWRGTAINPQGTVKLATVNPVPEPGSLMVLGTGLMGLAGFAIRRRK